MDAKIDEYIRKSDKWPEEIAALRMILLDCGLTEELKWGKPCFSTAGKNIVILQEMNAFLALMFFKGALLSDRENVLEDQGPNTRSARRIRFTSGADVARLATTVKTYVAEAIGVEEAGMDVGPPPKLVPVQELQSRIDSDAAFRAAFESLTPGRQREYNLHFSSAKQPKTRMARIEKYAPKILAGKGFRDR